MNSNSNDQWERYKRATQITGQILLDKLWNTMEPELYTLAFDQGNINDLTSEDLIMERIKTLSVTVEGQGQYEDPK